MRSLFVLRHPSSGRSFGRWVYLLLLTVLCTLSLVACNSQNTTAKGESEPFVGALLISFAPTTSYTKAQREITDQGLQPGKGCPSTGIVSGLITATMSATLWQPQGQQETYAKTHQLYVFHNMISFDIMGHLHRIADVYSIRAIVTYVQGASHPSLRTGYYYECPSTRSTPPAAIPLVWTAENGWFRTTVTFAAPLATYDAALYTISNLGLGLDTVCNPQGLVGQEQSFANTHTLTVQTAIFLTSTTWFQQLSQTPGVAAIAPPTQHPPCA